MDAGSAFGGGKWRIGGRDIGPITVGHALWLERLELLEIKSLKDYAFASLVLCNPWNKLVPIMGSRLFSLRLWWHLRSANEDNALLLQNMIIEAMAGAEMLYKNHNSSLSRSGTPSVLRLRVYLIEKMGISPSDVMNTPMVEAMADVCGSLEMNGVARVLSDDERAAAKANTAALARCRRA